MALYHCNTCDNPVAEDAVRCPRCGTSAPADSLGLLGGLLGFKNTPFEKEESYSSEPEQSNYGPSHEEHQRLVDELIESHEERQRLVDELIELKAEKRAREIIEAEQKKEEVRKAKREAEEAQELAKWSKMTPGQAMEEFERLSEIQRAIDVCSQSDTYFELSAKMQRLIKFL